jgi:hypothetical protein
MTALKTTAIRVLLVLQILWPEQSHAADRGNPRFDEELSKQEQLFRSRGEQRPEGYVIDRSLLSYIYMLSSAFGRSLADLGPKDRWLDIGAGRGQAILDYVAGRFDAMHADQYERHDGKAQAVAISIEDRRTALWHQAVASLEPNRIRYLSGRRLREYSSEELGKFQLITDVVGGFSYTARLSLFVEKVLDLLELNGSFYTVLQDVRAPDGTNKPHYEGSPFQTEITKADGSELNICAWLKDITCVEVACEFKKTWQPPIEVFHIRKICNEVTVPALTTVRFEAGTPPERGFQLKNK